MAAAANAAKCSLLNFMIVLFKGCPPDPHRMINEFEVSFDAGVR
jgi:hypothetical protein